MGSVAVRSSSYLVRPVQVAAVGAVAIGASMGASRRSGCAAHHRDSAVPRDCRWGLGRLHGAKRPHWTAVAAPLQHPPRRRNDAHHRCRSVCLLQLPTAPPSTPTMRDAHRPWRLQRRRGSSRLGWWRRSGSRLPLLQCGCICSSSARSQQCQSAVRLLAIEYASPCSSTGAAAAATGGDHSGPLGPTRQPPAPDHRRSLRTLIPHPSPAASTDLVGTLQRCRSGAAGASQTVELRRATVVASSSWTCTNKSRGQHTHFILF